MARHNDKHSAAFKSLVRYGGFTFLACLIASIYLGWTAIASWIVSLVVLATMYQWFFGKGTDGNHSPKKPCRFDRE